MQNQHPTTLSVSMSYGSPVPADVAVGKSITGLDYLAAAVEDEDDDDEEEDTDQPAQNEGVCIKHNKAQKKRTTCIHEGCTNRAVNGGVCIRHGAKVKTCKHEGCTNQRKQRGFCTRHYNLSIGRWNECKMLRRQS